MYPSIRELKVRRAAGSDAPADAGPARSWWQPRVTPNVYFLGLTSLFTDISSEMVTSIVPLFLTFQLRFSKFQLGVFNGAYQGLAAFTAIAGAAVADRRRRYKEVAGVGYATSAATKIGLVAAQSTWAPAISLLYADRAAKGLRTAPRDTLVSLSAEPGHVGEAFGVHRALDTAGALAGPLVAFALLSAAPDGYKTVFAASFWVGLIGLAILMLFVQNRDPDMSGSLPTKRPSVLSGFTLLKERSDYRRLVAAGTALSFVTVADALVYLSFQNRTSMNSKYFPLLYVGTALGYLLLAFPAGRISDRIGPVKVFLFGQALLLVVDVVLLMADPGPVALVLMLAALGVHYACSDGVLAAIATTILPSDLRTTGLAFLGAVMAVSAFAASAVFGAVWGWSGPDTAVAVFLAGLVIALGLTGWLLRPVQRAWNDR